MAKKNNNQKTSKIKSTKVTRDDFINAMKQENEQPIENQQVQQDANTKEQTKIVNDQENIENQSTSTTKNTTNLTNTNESDDKQPTELVDKAIVDKLLKEVKDLNLKINNLTEENKKLNQTLNEERKQLIVKLEEKANVANKLIEEKKAALVKEKETELNEAKDRIYIDVIANFLPPIILFGQTIKNAPANPAIQAYVQGYNMIIAMFNDKLNNLNVEQIDVNIGDEFNEAFMEAFDVEHVEGVMPNKVLKVVSEGFVYKGQRVIKFTSVVVSK